MVKNDIGTPVMIKEKWAESPDLRRGTVVGLSLWRNYTTGEMTGDRLIKFTDDTELYYAGYMFDPIPTRDRRTMCAHAYAGDGRFRYACTLELDHGGDDHEDHATEAPTIYAWIKPELIFNPRGLPMAQMPPRVLVGG